MNILKTLFTAFLVNLVFSSITYAGISASQAKEAVDKAIAYIQVNGTEKSYVLFNTPGNQFNSGDLYIFAYDMEGKNLAMGNNPKLTGRSLINLKTPDGKFLIRDFIEIIKAKGEGWHDYRWVNPEVNKLQDKRSYIKKIPGANAFLGCGFYN